MKRRWNRGRGGESRGGGEGQTGERSIKVQICLNHREVARDYFP
jgi:hypothetical protein